MGLANLPNLTDKNFDFGREESNWYDWLGSDNLVWIGKQTAQKLEINEGDKLSFLASGRIREMYIRKLIKSDTGSFPDDLIIADLPTVQNLLSRPNELNRVEVIIDRTDLREDSEYLEEIRRRIIQVLPENLTLKATQNRAADRASMTAAFRLNLTILSLIAILVGAYLILQALDAAVVRRRSEVATLISLGVGKGVLFLTFLFESVVIGLIGSVAGIGVGWLFAFLSAQMLADTVNALYFATTIEAISLTWLDCVFGLFLGFSFTILAVGYRQVMWTPHKVYPGYWSPDLLVTKRISRSFHILVAVPFFLTVDLKLVVALGDFLASGYWIFGSPLLSGHLMIRLADFFVLFKTPVARIAIGVYMMVQADTGWRSPAIVAGYGRRNVQMVDDFRSTIEQWFDITFGHNCMFLRV